MKKYKNIHGDSGVLAYETGSDFIKVLFAGNEGYIYNYEKPGKTKVEKMKKLAVAGKGLSTYISQAVRDKFYRKL